MSTPAERAREIADISETLVSGGYDATEGDDGSPDTTWTDFGIVCGHAAALAAENERLREALERIATRAETINCPACAFEARAALAEEDK